MTQRWPTCGLVAGHPLPECSLRLVSTDEGGTNERPSDHRSQLHFSVYHDRYQRTPDGWKFTERVYQIKYLDTTLLTGSPPDPVPGPTRESSPTRS